MTALQAYISQDRLRAIARGEPLLDRTAGSALFADISGFTALTEMLRNTLGPRRGAEELTKYLDKVYAGLIGKIENYGGSVIDFAGDSIICWFDDSHGSAAARAVGCASALQKVMEAFRAMPLPHGITQALTLKVAIATGPARRFVMGDPTIHCMDALAGATVSRTATAEHLSKPGDVLIDEATVDHLGSSLTIHEWRRDYDSGERFAVVSGSILQSVVQPALPVSPTLELSTEQLRPWFHKARLDREASFPTDFRPCVVLFLRFIGIDYDLDSAQNQLDAFVCSLQRIVERYEGVVLQITIGDKGSYAYINFGAFSAHEDDARRAVKVAIESRTMAGQLGFLQPLQIGITKGTLRVGAYGGVTRRTYGALGDDVNLAARLMMTASLGEILLSGQVQKATANDFVFEPRPPLPINGKAEPLPVFAVTDERKKRAIRLQEPMYALPMVGRNQELQVINDKLDLATRGQGQVIGIVAEAGLGKSRLVAEVIRSAHRKGYAGYGGACQSDGVNTPYLAWKSIWAAFFDVDPAVPLKKQIRDLESEIAERAPERLQAMPLLSILLDLEIPDNDFTNALKPEHRKNVLTALLQNCLSAETRSRPILIVIEDLHWLDMLSHELLESLAKALADCPICFILAYRPPQLMRLQAPRLEALPHFTKIELDELNTVEAEQAIRAKLAQLYPSRNDALPPLLVDKLMLRSQGNPFYLEELLNYLRDRGLDPRDSAALEKIELPDSLHTLVLSRIDQLSEREKTTLRAASIVGRLFRAAWLTGYYPALGDLTRVKVDLDKLDSLEITPLDSEPELAYLFKHIVTHEVTYESLPFSTRAQLHEQLAMYLEGIAAPVDMIAQHYGHSNNQAKQREYWQKAGDLARAAFANEAALDYYARLHTLLDEPREQGSLHLKRAEVYFGWGRIAEAREHVTLALNLIGQPLPSSTWQWRFRLLREIVRQAWHRLRFAILPALDEALLESSEPNEDDLELTRAYELLVFVDALASQSSLADVYYIIRVFNVIESARRRSPALARAYALMGIAAGLLPVPVHAMARGYFRQARLTLIGLDNPPALASVLYQTGMYMIGIGKWEQSQRDFQQAVEIFADLGDWRNWALTLNCMGFLAYFQGQFGHSIKLYADIYNEGQESNHLEHQTWGLNGQAMNFLRLGRMTEASDLLEKALPLYAVITDSILTEILSQGMLATSRFRQGQFDQAQKAADTAARLLAQASIPVFTSLDTYSTVAQVYLGLWEQSQAEAESFQMKELAGQACRSLQRFARTYPIAQPRSWLWQGLYRWLDNKPNQARLSWRKSLSAAQKLTMPYDEALAYYEMGRHSRGVERESNFARANEIFDRLGVVRFGWPSSNPQH
jgi:class 3 adenylate cyclase/tetratricopeptide (TPR) repeat protein